MESSSAPISTTTILDLTDDCLLGVFQYFIDNHELLPLVDVCQRFRQISQRHFARIPFDGRGYQSFEHILFYSEKILPLRFNRIFGPFLRSISMGIDGRRFPRVDSPEYEMNLVRLLNIYCCKKTLIELSLIKWNLTGEVTEAMQPWFQRLERLRIEGCKLSESFLQQPFGKLTSFTCYNMHIDEIGKFLKSNTQLKKFIFLDDNLDDRIFQYIADHVPGIESIRMGVTKRTSDSNMQCLGKLCKLQSLQLDALKNTNEFADFSSAVLREISGANIPLEKLHLFSLHPPIIVRPQYTDKLIDEISKLKTLKVLRWDGIPRLNRGHIIQLCENLTELSELRLGASTWNRKCVLNADLILEIVGNARKLQSLYCYLEQDLSTGYRDRSLRGRCINAGTFLEMVRMVEQRQEKLHLSVTLSSNRYAANVSLELSKCHADTLTLVVSQNRKLFEENYWKW